MTEKINLKNKKMKKVFNSTNLRRKPLDHDKKIHPIYLHTKSWDNRCYVYTIINTYTTTTVV